MSHFTSEFNSMLSKVHRFMGDAFNFTYWNPNGHYTLNLNNSIERDIAITLIVINKEFS